MTNRHDLAPHDRWQADLPCRDDPPAEETTPTEPALPEKHPADPEAEAARAFVDNLVKFTD